MYSQKLTEGVNQVVMSLNHQATLCFICKKAVPNKHTGAGCDYSKYFKPIKGWTAKKKRQKVYWKKNEMFDSYFVIDCPEFEIDEKSKKILERMNEDAKKRYIKESNQMCMR